MNLSGDQFGEYTKHYNAGWKHSSTASSPDPDKSVPYAQKHGKDPAHTKLVETAWDDGYLDAAVGRDKFALRGHRAGTEHVEGY